MRSPYRRLLLVFGLLFVGGPLAVGGYLYLATASVPVERLALLRSIWSQRTLPSATGLPSVRRGIPVKEAKGLKNLASVDRITFELDYGFQSEANHFRPVERKNEVLVYHHGHSDSFLKAMTQIGYFVERGYDVLAFAMPMVGPNGGVRYVDQQGKRHKLRKHKHFVEIEKEGGSPLRVFLEPVIFGIDYLEEQLHPHAFYMLGISGGGWTTTLIAALDPRVRASFPVAGSLPLELRQGAEHGDFEQSADRPYLAAASYLDQYLLAGLPAGRVQVQVLNRWDSCCFKFEGREKAVRAYEADVQQRLKRRGGGHFEVWVDDSHRGHQISTATLDKIFSTLQGLDAPPSSSGPPSGAAGESP